MEAFSFWNPTKIHFGIGMIKQLGKEMADAKIKSCLLIAGGGSIRSNGVYDQVIKSLSHNQIDTIELWGVRANPTLEKTRDAVDLAKQQQVQAILAVGGGSVIDTAKAVAAGVYLQDVWNAFTRQETITRALPLYTVLTLSATGSEMNGNAVITNTATRQKWGLFSPFLYPRLSIIDPAVQNSLPFKQTANGAMDALAHILEYYFASEDATVTLGINDSLQKTIIEMTDKLRLNSADTNARANLAWSATLALNGLSAVGLRYGDWACHSIEHAFSALHPDIAHGEGLGVIFPAWIEYVSEKDPQRFYRWAHNVWHEDTPIRAVHRFRDKLESWGLATSLRDLGIKERELPQLLELTMTSPTIGGVHKLTKGEVQALLMLAF